MRFSDWQLVPWHKTKRHMKRRQQKTQKELDLGRELRVVYQQRRDEIVVTMLSRVRCLVCESKLADETLSVGRTGLHCLNCS